MKKIIALLVVMLGFGFTATAQQKSFTVKSPTTQATPTDPEVAKAAAKDLTALTNVVALNAVEKQNFKGLFEYKHSELKKPLTADKKKVLLNSIDAKLRASLTPEQMAKLDSNKKVLSQLTN